MPYSRCVMGRVGYLINVETLNNSISLADNARFQSIGFIVFQMRYSGDGAHVRCRFTVVEFDACVVPAQLDTTNMPLI